VPYQLGFLRSRPGFRRSRTFGSGASQEQAIIGTTPNLAARLQGIAKPDSVVIADSTRRLVGSLHELEDLRMRSGSFEWAFDKDQYPKAS
jgi:class 3 adenylate cyclase